MAAISNKEENASLLKDVLNSLATSENYSFEGDDILNMYKRWKSEIIDPSFEEEIENKTKRPLLLLSKK